MKEHAKLFEVRGQQVLAYLDHDAENDNLLVLRFRLWCDAVDGPLQLAATINSEEALPEETVELWEKNTQAAFENLTVDKVEEVLTKMNLWKLLRQLSAQQTD
jgi:hypothetical protein